MNRVQAAASDISVAIDQLRKAKENLLQARNEQRIRVAVVIAELEEIFDILTDPECTPEIEEPDAPDDFDDCRWDADRIEATKSILFHEHIERR